MMTKTTELIDALAELSNVWRQQVEVDPTDPYDEGYSTGKHECYGSLIALIRKHGAASGGDSASLEQRARELYRKHTGNHPTIHCNRFPAWDELSGSAKDEWRRTAALRTDLGEVSHED